ncbi:putative RNA polymerase, sigma-24 subunit, ECF subfamily [Verrucomicrobia bacterium]|nr:putative RNA polymerase, sigma-24 subunit, ECF subfamily [Verrucomicrobiota bacterium]
MSPEMGQMPDEQLQVRKCQQGDPEALAVLRERCQGPLTGILIARGAIREEAEDVLAEVWAECVPGYEERPSLLEKFTGKCTVLGWLATVATNKWIDLKRRESRHAGPVPSDSAEAENPMEALATGSQAAQEDALVDLLRTSLQKALALCPPQAMVLLRLVYLHGVTQRELVRMLGWHESKVSRTLAKTMAEIEAHTLGELKKRDPWFNPTWQDFLHLCETRELGFL